MKQFNLFNESKSDDSNKYTKKIKAPIYEAKNRKPHVLELYDRSKTQLLINKINCLDIAEDEKKFLLSAAERFTVINFSKVADYYAHSNKAIQEAMESLALVIVDFDKAIEYGFAKLSEEMTQQYIRENEE